MEVTTVRWKACICQFSPEAFDFPAAVVAEVLVSGP